MLPKVQVFDSIDRTMDRTRRSITTTNGPMKALDVSFDTLWLAKNCREDDGIHLSTGAQNADLQTFSFQN